MTLRLLVDMNLSPAWVPLLEASGFDFGALLAITGAEAPSVFQIRTEDVSPDALGPRAAVILSRFELELDNGALVVVDEARDRVRILPLAKG